MQGKKCLFLVANFPHTADISQPEVLDFVRRKFERDFPWLLVDDYKVVLSGLGKRWHGIRAQHNIISHAGWRASGWIPLDAVLAWLTHFLDAFKASRRALVISIASTPEAGLGIAIARLLYKGRVRLVVRVIGHTASKALYVHGLRWRFRILERIEAFVLRQADLVVPMGQFTTELALNKGADPAKIVVLPFPVRWADSARVEPLALEPYVLFVGRLEKEKGVHILLEAMKTVLQRVPSARLLIAGDGSYRRELEAQVECLGLTESALFFGWLGPEELQQLYRKARVLVLPSILEEGLGMVLVEAGLMGRPVIGSDLGGIRDIIQHGYNGFLVPPGDAKALAETILEILQDAELACRMGLANMEVARAYLRARDKALEQVRLAIMKWLESR
ncbi:Alpha-D-kanosaminyltransferase [bacterium HR17]|uniref:Alpha-D-kanosaminyltransferase n=1 Tax=Candidatus Fervidibacter japonicus TaxID=2035412 RepID=A0A2H5XFU0_9BACT|nr:Alpha-D-kanosaminyltransferase [bacterium HR17]